MSTAKDIEALFEDFLARGIPGGSLHVVKKGKTLYEGYFGVSDINTKKAIDENKSTDELKKLSDELQQTMFAISQKAYEAVQKEGENAQSANSESASSNASSSNNNDDDVIDAEYVKE